MADIESTIMKMKLDALTKPVAVSAEDVEPTLTIAKIEAAVHDIVHIEQANGYHGVAMKHGIPLALVKKMEGWIQSRVSVLTADTIKEGEVL